MSVRNAVSRVRPHGPGSAGGRGTPAVAGVAGLLMAAAVILAAVVLLLLADAANPGALLAVMAVLGLAALGLLGWGVLGAARRASVPVERLHAELGALDERDLSRRIEAPAAPAGADVRRLIDRVNALLDRVEDAALRRRAFIADASHELRTPITALRTRIEFALHAPDEGEAADTLRESLGDVKRLHHIVDDLFVLAAMDHGMTPDRETLDIGALVGAEVGRRDPPVATTVSSEPGLLVEADRERLCRMLLNLIANAERHAATLIEVEVRAERAGPGTAGEVVVEVRDDGPGIPPAERDRVFERFSRLDAARSRAAGGSGLGLAIARQIAVAHGGRLYVADAVRGANLVLRLPLAATG